MCPSREDRSDPEGDGTADLAETFSTLGTIGVEEEFFVVDAAGRPTAGTDQLVYERDPPELLAGRLDHELFKCVVETQTPTIPAGELATARDRLLAVREALVEHARPDYRIAAAGLHPAARWRELEHAEKPRYRSQLDRIRYPQHRNTTAGLHVHVGVDDPDKAVWVANRVRWHLPVLLALSVNSPFWNGFDTGLASARAVVFETLPNTGMPTRFAGIEDYRRFERRMIEGGAVRDRGELWFDVRPHTGHGTVEVRAPDAQRDPDRVLDLVEYVHALVVDLAERYEDRADPWDADPDADAGVAGDSSAADPVRRELLDANKWAAARHGHDAAFLRRDRGTIDLATAVDRVADRLDADAPRRLLDRESPARRQRRIRDERGSDALRESLVLPAGAD